MPTRSPSPPSNRPGLGNLPKACLLSGLVSRHLDMVVTLVIVGVAATAQDEANHVVRI